METLKELLAIGRQYFENKQYSQAETYLRRVIEKDARYADVLNMLGVISHAEGKFASSIEFFKESLRINPRYTEALLNLAVLYNDLGQYDEAKKLYKHLKVHSGTGKSDIEPVLRGKLSNLHADIGDIYRSIGLYSHSIDEYKKALALNPNYFDIRTKLGIALREHDAFPESLKELKSVIRDNDKYYPALVQLGITYYAMGKVADAGKCWEDVLENDPNNEYARMYTRLCAAMSGGEAPKKAKKTHKKTKKK